MISSNHLKSRPGRIISRFYNFTKRRGLEETESRDSNFFFFNLNLNLNLNLNYR